MFILSARSQIKPQPKHQVIKLVFWRLKSRLKSKKDRKLRPLMSNQPLMKRKFINFPMAGLRSSFSKKSTKYAWKNQTRYPSSILWSIKKRDILQFMTFNYVLWLHQWKALLFFLSHCSTLDELGIRLINIPDLTFIKA